MESNKVLLPKEVAEAIKHCRLEEFSNRVILRFALDERGTSELRDLLYKFAEEKFDALVSALYIGYEVEMTAEDKVREFYTLTRDNLVNPNSYYSNEVKCETVIHVLDLLNIKIKGVNDNESN